MVKYTSVSDIGLIRKENQDDLAILEHNDTLLSVVCDGIGGSNAGTVASHMCVDLLCKDFLRQSKFESLDDVKYWFKTAIHKVNEQIFKASLKNINYQGMGTTLVCVVISKDFNIGFNIGDSRLYRVRNEVLECLSHDQTFAYEMYLRDEIEARELSTHPKRHILMNAVGIDKHIDFETINFDKKWDHLLISSDGLHGYVSDQDIEAVFKEGDLISRRNQLLHMALNSGGYDNISLVLIEGDHHE